MSNTFPFTKKTDRVGEQAIQDGYHIQLHSESYGLACFSYTLQVPACNQYEDQYLLLTGVYSCPFFVKCQPAFPGTLKLMRDDEQTPVRQCAPGDYMVIERLPRFVGLSPLSECHSTSAARQPAFYYLHFACHREAGQEQDDSTGHERPAHSAEIANQASRVNTLASQASKRLKGPRLSPGARRESVYKITVNVRSPVLLPGKLPTIVRLHYHFVSKTDLRTLDIYNINWKMRAESLQPLTQSQQLVYSNRFGTFPTHGAMAIGKFMLTKDNYQNYLQQSDDNGSPPGKVVTCPRLSKHCLHLLGPVYAIYGRQKFKIVINDYILDSQPCCDKFVPINYGGIRFQQVLRITLRDVNTLSNCETIGLNVEDFPLVILLNSRVYLTEVSDRPVAPNLTLPGGFFVHAHNFIVRLSKSAH